jgi:metal-responsive CopG/Arc/MetJ family transcriptional regulator
MEGYSMNNTFIPKNQDKTVISIRLNNDMIKMIYDLARTADVSRNELIRKILEFGLERTAENKQEENKKVSES